MNKLDLDQLQPVFGKPYFLINPDVILTEIMRQAKNDPIIHLSQRAIKGKQIHLGKYGDKCFVINKEDISNNMLIKTDINICGRNKTRDHINKYIREDIYKIDKPYPVIGEKLICRQNNWRLSVDDNKIFLINGLIGYVKETHLDTYNKKSICIDFRPEFLEDTYFEKVSVDYDFLFNPYNKKNDKRSYYNKFEFAHAISAHLAQGSQYDTVLVYDEKFGSNEFHKKWLYTALSRAISGLILAI